jgi:Ca2+-binding RTX toxin-like protein
MLKGGAGDDILDGDRGVDTANYNDGAHYGNLHISIGDGANDGYVIDGEKDDVTGETENLIGTDGDDTLVGDSKDNYIRGGGGHDLIMGNSGNDRLEGSYWPDTIYGGRGNDTLIGYGGKDYLYGDRGDDFLDGGAARDHVEGGPGHDTFIEGFFDTNTGDVVTLSGTLKHRGVTDSGPNRWVLQTGTLNQDLDQLLLDVSAVQSTANALDQQVVTVTGSFESRLDDDFHSIRVMVVTKMVKG